VKYSAKAFDTTTRASAGDDGISGAFARFWSREWRLIMSRPVSTVANQSTEYSAKTGILSPETEKTAPSTSAPGCGVRRGAGSALRKLVSCTAMLLAGMVGGQALMAGREGGAVVVVLDPGNLAGRLAVFEVQLALAEQRASRADGARMLTQARFGEIVFEEMAMVGVLGDARCSDLLALGMRNADHRLMRWRSKR